MMLLLWFMAFMAQGEDLSGAEVLRKVEAAFSGVNDYTVTVDVVADVERLKVSPMHAVMYYKRPDKIHFDSEGFVLLQREGMGLPFSKLTERFAADSVRRESLEGVPVYRTVLRAKKEGVRMPNVVLYVDADRWVPVRLHAPLKDGSSMNGRFSFERAGGFWMPSRLEVVFEGAPERPAEAVQPAPQQPSPYAEPQAGGPRFIPPRAGKVIVQYSGYRINTGLSDDVFKEQTP